jgi:hypothetical protein
MTIPAFTHYPNSLTAPTTFAHDMDTMISEFPAFIAGANAVATALDMNDTTDASTTSNAIGTGAKTFTVTAGKSFLPGMWLVIADDAAPSTNSMSGQVTSYSSTTLVMNIVLTLGSGTKTAWTISQTAPAAIIGLQTIWIPAGAMITRTTSGAAYGSIEMPTNKNMFRTLDFDTAADEFAQFAIQMPKSWNEGTVTAAMVWSHAATTTNFGVAWFLQGVAISNDDAGDVAFGTAVGSVDTGGTTNDIYISPTTAAITIGGTPAANDYVMFQIYRDVSDGGDTLAIDARLHGVQLYYTVDAGTDN